MQKAKYNITRSYLDTFNNQIPIAYAKFEQKVIKLILKLWKNSNKIMKKSLYIINNIIEISLFVILIIQTIHVLSNRTTNNINVRHLLVKWIYLICILSSTNYIKDHTQLDQLFRFMCNCIALSIVYPSKFIKDLHLKSFAYKQNGQTINDLYMDKPSLFDQIIASSASILLKITKFIIIFVPLTLRRQISDQMKQINTILVQQKEFWKIYSSKYSQDKKQIPLQLVINQKRTPFTNDLSVNSSKFKQIQQPSTPLSPYNQKFKNNLGRQSKKDSSIKTPSKMNSFSIIKANAQEHIQVNLPSLNKQKGYNKKYVFYRNVDIQYNPQSTKLKIYGQQDKKVDTYNLIQILMIDQFFIQFQCQDQDDLISIKFKTKQSKQDFINSVHNLS